MAATQTVGYIEGIAAVAVSQAFTHQTGTERVAASVAVMDMQDTSTAKVQLTSTFPVIGKFGALQRIMGGPTEVETASQVYLGKTKCVIYEEK